MPKANSAIKSTSDIPARMTERRGADKPASLTGRASMKHSSSTTSGMARDSVSDVPDNRSRSSQRHSVSAFFSMVAEQDEEAQDELGQAQRVLRELKAKISLQSKINYSLEKDVRWMDGRIASIIHDRMAAEDMKDLVSQLDGTSITSIDYFPDKKKMDYYSNLLFLLQSEPRHIATLTRLVTLSEMDTLLQTVMFTIYGNQYESREEHLLLTMFQLVLAAQFETTQEFGNLLRANTPVSRMMTTYTRRGPGQAYLKQVLASEIDHVITEDKQNLELNPLKVYEELIQELEDKGESTGNMPRGVTSEEAAGHPLVIKTIEPRMKAIERIANRFLDVIIGNISQVPYGIRWICKQIRSLTKRKYPQATDASVCSFIGGFFFLRFINPAIVTPQAYMLIKATAPAKNPRRTLTFVAKLLQNLANKPSYSKEAYMKSLAPFVMANQARINKFFNDLCEVSDFYDSLEMDQYMALTKREITLNITLNELYNTHALLIQHRDALTPEKDSKLGDILKKLGDAPSLVPRNENASLDLKLFPEWETHIVSDLSGLNADNALTHHDLLYMETKSVLVQLIRSMPTLSLSPESTNYQGRTHSLSGVDLHMIPEQAATSKDPVLVRKGIKAREMLRELESLGVVDLTDKHNQLTEEVMRELAHLGSLQQKTTREVESLKQVYQTILGHNEYLQSQLDTYKEYLNNARIQHQSAANKKGKKGLTPIAIRNQNNYGDSTPQNSPIGYIINSANSVANSQKGSNVSSPTVAKAKRGGNASQQSTKLGPYEFSHRELEREQVICESKVPVSRQDKVEFWLDYSPSHGSFNFDMRLKDRPNPILHMNIRWDDLLSRSKENVQVLDLEYVYLDINRLISFLEKKFMRR
ncbi:RasGAP protein [Mycoemilia scoparia]|uniref:RasGAP protein n=1 Tax=Mycoemilia scoparia TaxID=417184 RepID=A0A9W7ZPW9_9FUNG|nr:RasGAP protein [Mycoemilia scoparia]